MTFHENRLLSDDVHEISYLIFTKSKNDVAKFVVCFSRDLRLYGKDIEHSGKSVTIRESNHGLGVCKEHYA